MAAPAVAAATLKTQAVTTARAAAAQRLRIIAAASIALGTAVLMPMTATVIAIGGTRDPAHASGGTSGGALADIPAEALAAYRDAAASWHMDWAILAGIGKLECDHGRSQLAGCNPPDTMNSAGARGYMQFIGSTWRRGLGQHQLEPRSSPPAPDGRGYATDGDRDGDADPWSWPDATHSAARYLTANDVNHDVRQAVWHYNHDNDYVARVLQLAASYRNASTSSTTDVYEGEPGHVPLADVQCPVGGSTTVHTQIASSVTAMYHAATSAGLHLCGGGYRDPQQQIALRRAHCGTTDYAIYQMPSSQCTPPTAIPGTSMHERGLAIDLTCEGVTITTRISPCYQWLAVHAASFGLYELASGAEPWHWSTNGG